MRYNDKVLRFYEFLSKYPSGNQFLSKLIPKILIGNILRGSKQIQIRSMKLYGGSIETLNG